jgi:hypothetical protein
MIDFMFENFTKTRAAYEKTKNDPYRNSANHRISQSKVNALFLRHSSPTKLRHI